MQLQLIVTLMATSLQITPQPQQRSSDVSLLLHLSEGRQRGGGKKEKWDSALYFRAGIHAALH